MSQSLSANINGFESPAIEFAQAELDVGKLLVNDPLSTYFAVAEGHSMVKAGIFDQDILIVSRSVPLIDGAIVVANLNGEFVCKRLSIKNRCLLSCDENDSAYYISDEDTFQVEGTVTSSIRLHQRIGKQS